MKRREQLLFTVLLLSCLLEGTLAIKTNSSIRLSLDGSVTGNSLHSMEEMQFRQANKKGKSAKHALKKPVKAKKVVKKADKLGNALFKKNLKTNIKGKKINKEQASLAAGVEIEAKKVKANEQEVASEAKKAGLKTDLLKEEAKKQARKAVTEVKVKENEEKQINRDILINSQIGREKRIIREGEKAVIREKEAKIKAVVAENKLKQEKNKLNSKKIAVSKALNRVDNASIKRKVAEGKAEQANESAANTKLKEKVAKTKLVGAKLGNTVGVTSDSEVAEAKIDSRKEEIKAKIASKEAQNTSKRAAQSVKNQIKAETKEKEAKINQKIQKIKEAEAKLKTKSAEEKLAEQKAKTAIKQGESDKAAGSIIQKANINKIKEEEKMKTQLALAEAEKKAQLAAELAQKAPTKLISCTPPLESQPTHAGIITTPPLEVTPHTESSGVVFSTPSTAAQEPVKILAKTADQPAVSESVEPDLSGLSSELKSLEESIFGSAKPNLVDQLKNDIAQVAK